MSEDDGVTASQHNPFNLNLNLAPALSWNPIQMNNTKAESHAWKPSVFTGDRKTLEKFLRDCLIYISSNNKDFRTDEAKTQFILSYIDRGEADSWKEFYVTNLPWDDDENVTWPTVPELTNNLHENFAKEDQVKESFCKLETMKQGEWTVLRLQRYRLSTDDNLNSLREVRVRSQEFAFWELEELLNNEN